MTTCRTYRCHYNDYDCGCYYISDYRDHQDADECDHDGDDTDYYRRYVSIPNHAITNNAYRGDDEYYLQRRRRPRMRLLLLLRLAPLLLSRSRLILLRRRPPRRLSRL